MSKILAAILVIVTMAIVTVLADGLLGCRLKGPLHARVVHILMLEVTGALVALALM